MSNKQHFTSAYNTPPNGLDPSHLRQPKRLSPTHEPAGDRSQFRLLPPGEAGQHPAFQKQKTHPGPSRIQKPESQGVVSIQSEGFHVGSPQAQSMKSGVQQLPRIRPESCYSGLFRRLSMKKSPPRETLFQYHLASTRLNEQMKEMRIQEEIRSELGLPEREYFASPIRSDRALPSCSSHFRLMEVTSGGLPLAHEQAAIGFNNFIGACQPKKDAKILGVTGMNRNSSSLFPQVFQNLVGISSELPESKHGSPSKLKSSKEQAAPKKHTPTVGDSDKAHFRSQLGGKLAAVPDHCSTGWPRKESQETNAPTSMHSHLASFLSKRPFPERARSGQGEQFDLKRRKQAEITEEDRASSSYGTEKICSKSPIEKPKQPRESAVVLGPRQRSQKDSKFWVGPAYQESVGQAQQAPIRFDESHEINEKLSQGSETVTESEEDEDFKPTTKPQKKSSKQRLQSKPEPKADEEDPSQQQFVCFSCNQQFKSAQSLGGHISRQHPKSSLQYKQKMQRRQEREFDRKLLKLAKEEHLSIFGEDAPINRVKIRSFKKQIRAQFEAGELAIEGFTPQTVRKDSAAE